MAPAAAAAARSASNKRRTRVSTTSSDGSSDESSDGSSSDETNHADINVINNAELRANSQNIMNFIRESRPKNTRLAYDPKQKEFQVCNYEFLAFSNAIQTIGTHAHYN